MEARPGLAGAQLSVCPVWVLLLPKPGKHTCHTWKQQLGSVAGSQGGHLAANPLQTQALIPSTKAALLALSRSLAVQGRHSVVGSLGRNGFAQPLSCLAAQLLLSSQIPAAFQELEKPSVSSL